MNNSHELKATSDPVLIHRPRGDWLALAPQEANLSLGVIGETEAEARVLFARSEQRWREILASEPT